MVDCDNAVLLGEANIKPFGLDARAGRGRVGKGEMLGGGMCSNRCVLKLVFQVRFEIKITS